MDNLTNQQLITVLDRKPQTQMSSPVSSTEQVGKKSHHFSANSSRKQKGKFYFLIPSMRPALLLYQDRIKTLQEKKTQTNISQEQRRKNLQQDVNKSDPTSYSENYARQLSGVNPSHARLVQQLKINQCNPPHQWAKNKPIT